MCVEIYYFSGTGNSLFVAKELQKRVPEATLIPMVSLLDNKVIRTQGKIIGFVFPEHALTIPVVVRKFIQRLELDQAEYIFAVVTRWGSVFHGFKKISQLLNKKKKRLNSQFIVNMGGNDPRNIIFTVPSSDDILTMERIVLEKLDVIKEAILTKADSHERDTHQTIKTALNPVSVYLIEKLVVLAMEVVEYLGGVNYFYIDNKCNGCGMCEKVCLSKKITMVDDKPIWKRKTMCYMCYACINYCPKTAIQIHDIPGVKSHTEKNDRYPHPYATAKDISIQRLCEDENSLRMSE